MEDDAAVANLISAFLGRCGFSVAGSVRAGDEALVQIELQRPDLVLMDIALEGGLDGIQTANAVADRYEIPVVFLTGLSDEETLARAREAKAFGYLLKPFEQEDLKASIDLALSKHREENRLRQVDRWAAAVVQSIADGIVVGDATGRITFLNPAAETLLGRAAEEAIGLPLGSVLHLGEELECAKPAVPAATADATEELRFETTVRHEDGIVRPVECVVRPMGNDGGRIVGRVIVLRDLSGRREAELELREARERIRALAGQIESARESERRRIAREIHDEFGQLLTGLKMDLVRLEKRGDARDGGWVAKLADALALVDELVRQVRRLAEDLRPGVLDDLGLVAALEGQARAWQERTGIPCGFVASPEHIELPPESATAVFRIFQEALTNVARHARATAVSARIAATDGWVRLSVADDGAGFTEERSGECPRSFGLQGMRERSALAGGTVRIEGRPGTGTTVTVEIPAANGSSGARGPDGPKQPADVFQDNANEGRIGI